MERKVAKLSIPHDALVFVGDGQKALFLRNAGDDKYPNLVTEHVLRDKNPPTRAQGTDRPGRGFKRAATNRRSGMEMTDWHEIEKERFARAAAVAIEELARAQKAGAILVVAPPHTLAELRDAWHPDIRRLIIGEIDKDLTKHSVPEIENHLFAGTP
jgi:protein required for attachment to host cells